MKKEQLSYSSAQAELQQIVRQLQDDQINMDDLAAKVKRAAELIDWCRQHLRQTETEIGQIMEK